MQKPISSSSYYEEPLKSLPHIFSTSLTDGLSEGEVRKRYEQYGPNSLPERDRSSFLERLFAQILNPLVLILIAAFVFTLYIHEYIDAGIVILAVVVNIAISLYQEGRAENIFESLQKNQRTKAHVRRDGRSELVAGEELVVGDIVELTAGEIVPADMRIIEASNASADEASLTGESLPTEKNNNDLEGDKNMAERSNMLYAGTLLTSGQVVGLVVAIGNRTEFGRLSDSVQARASKTPLQKELSRVAFFITTIVLVIAVVVIALGVLQGRETTEMILIAIALSVSAVPEGLPAAITVILAVGMKHVLEAGGLVKSLLAAETLGTTDIIITDKTGTLTAGQMSLVGIYPAYLQNPEVNTLVELDESEEHVLKSALYSSDGYVLEEDGELVAHGRPVEKALVHAGLHFGINRAEINEHHRQLDFLTFSSERRYAAVLIDNDPQNLFIATGAPENLLALSGAYLTKAGEKKQLKPQDKARLSRLQREASKLGQRLIAVVEGQTPKKNLRSVEDNVKNVSLTFLGFLAFSDPVRRDVPAAIRTAEEAGTRVIVATGDNIDTARAIAKDAGLIVENAIEGRELADLNAGEVYDMLQHTNVMARMRPEQKKMIATVLQERGHIVAMTGDGVNDAPALSSANIGIAVASGTDVAKAASDLILLENSFSTIIAAIKEGRRLLDNVRKAVIHLVSTGFGEMFLIVGSLLLALPLPILTSQILWVNIIQGGLLTFGFAAEPAEANVMKRKPTDKGRRGILTPQVKRVLWGSGIGIGLITLFVFYYLYLILGWSIEEVRSVMLALLSIDAIVTAFAIKNLDKPLWKINPVSNKLLAGSLFISFCLLLASFLAEPLRNLLQLTPLNIEKVFVIILVAVADLIMVEVVKYLARDHSANSDRTFLDRTLKTSDKALQ